MKQKHKKINSYTTQWILLCPILLSLLLLPSCGVYSKAPAVNPNEIPVWSGPLLEDADMENVRIYIRPNQHTITLNMEDLDGDLRILLEDYDTSRGEDSSKGKVVEELSVDLPQNGRYVLVIQKTKP